MLRRAAPISQRLVGRRFSAAAEAVGPSKWRRRLLLASGAVGFTAVGVGSFSYSSEKKRQDREKKIRTVEEKPVPTRADQIKRLASGEEFDILVVGGGATGAGVALEAQLRGLKVACVEQEDFASGTSSKSTKLLWAGSRYLVKGLVKLFSPSSLMNPVAAWSEFAGTWHMVLGCFRERTYMLTMNPHITNWVPIAVPLDKWIIWPPPFDYPPAALGPCTGLFVIFFKFYDFLGQYVAPNSYVMSSERARTDFPQMDGKRMKYVSVFYEGEHNDARTNVCIALTAAMYGSCIANYAKVERIVFDEKGVATGAEVLDKTDPAAKPFAVKAKKIVYCGGPFTDGLRQLSEGKDVKPMVNASGGTHIVLPPYYCPRHIGMVDMMTSRGSFLFFLPWEGYTLVGTTDVKTKPDLHHEVPEDEIQYLINECEKYLSPNLQVRRRDVMSAWYGIRPLCGDPNAQDQSSASRDHVVSHHPTNGITFVSGGKWTTWREMAEDGVDQVLERHPDLKKKAGPSKTLETPLLGTGKTSEFPEGYHENLAVRLSQKYDVAFDVAQHLVRNYGTRAADVLSCVEESQVKGSRSGLYKHYPRLYEGAAATTGYPYLEAEVRYAVNQEYAMTPADVLSRRTRLAFLNSTAARLCLPRVVEIMAECLGWSDARALEEHERAEQILARDFAGPVPNKVGALLRTSCTADVKDVFDKIDVERKGTLTKAGISKAAAELGFPLSQAELQKAVNEMDTDRNGEVHFPEFLAWWNSSEKSQDVQKKIYMGSRAGSRWKTIEQ
ncbi:GPD2 [Symbiodinium sp. CCMP2592]|nr:GPD2 [Symbiodinium sp. CCMP2592]